MTDLEKFRAAKSLRWNRWTVFEPGRGDDGTLYADDDPDGLPVDTWPAADADALHLGQPVALPGGIRVIQSDGPGPVVAILAAPSDISELHNTIRSWTRYQLGRDDVLFTICTPDGGHEPVEEPGAGAEL